MKALMFLLLCSLVSSSLYAQMGDPEVTVFYGKSSVFEKNKPWRLARFTAHFDVEKDGDFFNHVYYRWMTDLDDIAQDPGGEYPGTRAKALYSSTQMGGYVKLDVNWGNDHTQWDPLQGVPGLPDGVDTETSARGQSPDYATAAASPDTFFSKIQMDWLDDEEVWQNGHAFSDPYRFDKPTADDVEVVGHKCDGTLLDVYFKVDHIPDTLFKSAQIKAKDATATWQDWGPEIPVESTLPPAIPFKDYSHGHKDEYYVLQKGYIDDAPAYTDAVNETIDVRVDILDAEGDVIMSSDEETVACEEPSGGAGM